MSEAPVENCPFCGKAPTVRKENRGGDGGDWWWVDCTKARSCPAFAYTGAATKKEAVRRWNTRAPAARASEGEAVDPLDLAIMFHHAYERLAPSVGYDTRVETRIFDPESPNGKLMVAVCAEILAKLDTGALETPKP